MARSFEMEGTLKLVFDTQTFASGFSKREFVVETSDDRYPQAIKFECVKDKVTLLDAFTPGDPVVVSFDIRGNEYKEKYYVNLNAWKITRAGGEAKPPAADRPPSSLDQQFDNEADISDDIPF